MRVVVGLLCGVALCALYIVVTMIVTSGLSKPIGLAVMALAGLLALLLGFMAGAAAVGHRRRGDSGALFPVVAVSVASGISAGVVAVALTAAYLQAYGSALSGPVDDVLFALSFPMFALVAFWAGSLVALPVGALLALIFRAGNGARL